MLQTIIERISNEFLEEAKNSPRLLEDLASMEKYMAESYGGRVFIELLQNADDALSTKIKVLQVGKNIIFANNGRPFNENDVISISRSGASSKARGESIGYRGIGFKSSAYITKEIVIYSSDTYFTFSKSICAHTLHKDEQQVPTIRIPFLVKNENLEYGLYKIIEVLKSEGFTSIFIFKEAKMDEFLEDVKEINNGYFIFLRNIKSCEISILGNSANFEINRKVLSNYEIVSISSFNDEQWLIFGEGVTKLAFRIENGKIIPCTEDESVYHCYLPTVDKVAFPFKINGDFSTDPSRKHLIIDENSIETIQQSAKLIFVLITEVINPKYISEYVDFLSVLCQKASFSKANTIFNDELKQIINSKNVQLNDGSIIKISEYKLFPDWLEESERAYLRGNSLYVQNRSFSNTVYQKESMVDLFIQQYSQARYTVTDFIEIMAEEGLANKIFSDTQGKIIGHIIKATTLQMVSGDITNFEKFTLHCNNETITLQDLVNNPNVNLEKNLKDSISNIASNGEIREFCKMYSIRETIFLNDILIEKSAFETLEKFTNNKIKLNISKWKSAEQQCMEIERELGNNAIDVSRQNLGYDIVSIEPSGEKRYIEVKSIGSIGSPFSITNNEYTAAHQLGENFYICLLSQSESKLSVIYIKNPLSQLQLEKRVRQWEWLCEIYDGQEITVNY